MPIVLERETGAAPAHARTHARSRMDITEVFEGTWRSAARPRTQDEFKELLRRGIRNSFNDEALHNLQEEADSLAESNGLSENGLMQISRLIKKVHDDKVIMIEAMTLLFTHVSNFSLEGEELRKEVEKLKKLRELDAHVLRSEREVREMRRSRNKSFVSLLRILNTELVDEVRARNASKARATKNGPVRRSKRHDPYGRKAKKAEEEEWRRGKEVVALALPVAQLRDMVRFLEE